MVAGIFALLLLRRRHSLRPRAIMLEAVLVVVAYGAYYVVRGLTEGDTASAIDNAQAIIDFERWSGTYWEPEMQEFVLRYDWLTVLSELDLYLVALADHHSRGRVAVPERARGLPPLPRRVRDLGGGRPRILRAPSRSRRRVSPIRLSATRSRDARGSLVHVRQRDSGECVGCVDVGLYEILRPIIAQETRDNEGTEGGHDERSPRSLQPLP